MLRLRFWQRWALLLLMPILIPLLFAPAAYAKDYSIPRVDIDIFLEPDGSLRVTEHRTYRFEGAYSFAFQTFKLWDQSAITDLSLVGPSGPYLPAEDEAPGTYTWDGERLDWYFRAQDQEQTFTLSYRVTDTIALHADNAELHWQVIGEEWEKGTGLVTATIHLPAAPIEAWLGGSRDALTVDGQTLQIAWEDLPSEQALTVRALLPKEAVPASTLRPDGKTIDSILKRAGRRPDPLAQGLHYGWAALTLLAAFWFYRLHVRRSQVEAQPPTDSLPPLVVAKLLDSNPPDGIRTALADLAVRGALLIEAGPDEDDWRFTRVPGAALTVLEEEAITLLIPPDRDSITLSEWQTTLGKRTKTGEALQRWWGRVAQELPDGWRLPHRLWGWALAAVTVPLLIFTSPGLSMIAPIVASLVLVVLSIMQRRWSDEAEGVRSGLLAERDRVSEQEVQPPGVAFALALGLPLTAMLDPTLAIGQRFAWLRETDAAMTTTYSHWHESASSSGGGGGGANGGGGGGAG